MRIEVPRQIGQMVTRARKEHGLTQGQVAKAAHVSRQLVNRLEAGDATGVSLSKLMAILAVVGCHLWVEPDDEGAPHKTVPSNLDQETKKQTATFQNSPVQELAYLYQPDESLFSSRNGMAGL